MPRPKKAMNQLGQYQCSSCKRWHAPEDFFKNRQMSNGLTSKCKTCFTSYNKEKTRLIGIRSLEEGLSGTYPRSDPGVRRLVAELVYEKNNCDDNDRWDVLNRKVENMIPVLESGMTLGEWRLEEEERAELFRRAHESWAQPVPTGISSDSDGQSETSEEGPLFYQPQSWGPPVS
jgi:hypothetical protein